MKIDFDALERTDIEHFRDGSGSVTASVYADSLGRIMKVEVHEGSSIGMHRHETNYEVIYVLGGSGKAMTKEGVEPLLPGIVHYCPKDGEHELVNTGAEDLVLLCVLPDVKE